MNDSIEEEKLKNLIFAGKRCIRAEKCNDSIEIFTDLKLYDKALNDAQNAILLDPRNSHIHWLASKIMCGIPNKPSYISEMQSGEVNYDETSPNYNSLKELLDLYTNEKLTENKKFDILLDIPIEVAMLILSYFSIPELLSLKRDYTANSNAIKDHSKKNYDMSFSKNTTINCFKNNCYNLYFANILIDNQKSRNLGSGFISALTKKSHPRLSTFCVSRLTKITENSKILALIGTFLQTNHLTKLCFSYTSLITCRIVYNIALKCTNLKILDLFSTPNVDWEKILTRIAAHTNNYFFKNLEDLYVENQLKDYILISNRMSQLGITFKKIKTLSLAWNINKRSIMGLSLDIFDIFDIYYEAYSTTFDLSFSAFPNIAHVCLDGFFEIYKPVLSFGHTSTDVVPKHSKKLKCLNIKNVWHLQDYFIESILNVSSFLAVLNLSGCSCLSASFINLLIQQCSQHLEIIELARTNADSSTQLTIAKFMPKCIRRINLDQTLSTGESIKPHQENKIKKLDMLNFESRAPKIKLSELKKPKAQDTQIINIQPTYRIIKFKRSDITISILGCNRIWPEDVMLCKIELCDTFTRLVYNFNEREHFFDYY
ncbi:hypothetical protein BB561_003070 [Smittium simulii]|uniref:Uncharacterized protein n=1 Tax=Smittium simulii TaxID=133385 RepID=A0A2T9YN49_9FUNG|nr:hypothetical protein BB561_003070 [Smittium simulii]